IGVAGAILGDDLVLVGNFVDDLLDVAAVGAPEDIDLFLEDHSFTNFLGLVHLAHGIGLDHFDKFLLAIDKDAAPFVYIVGNPGNGAPVILAIHGRWSGKR